MKKKSKQKSGKLKTKKPTLKKISRVKKTGFKKNRMVAQKTVKVAEFTPAPQKSLTAAQNEKVKEISEPKILGFRYTKRIIVWSFVLASVFAVFSIVSSYGRTGDGQNESFLNKLPQAATLNFLADDDEAVTVIATGDVLLARYVETLMRRNKDYTFPFKNISDFLKNADITIGNLETPLFPGLNTPTDSMTFRGDPQGVQGLLAAGFDVMTLANNHSMNYRASGLLRTLNELKKAGILYAGAGNNQDEAHSPAVIEAKGKKIAFYAYNDRSIPPGFHGEATYNQPGIAAADIEAMQNDVRNAAATYDFVVVSLHGGREYKKEPTKFQRDFAHAAIDAGASAVIGNHPHVVQPVEYYGEGVIFYSLGNFVFDQFFSREVQTGLVVKIALEEGEKPKVELYPVKIENTQPRLLEGEGKERALSIFGLKIRIKGHAGKYFLVN